MAKRNKCEIEENGVIVERRTLLLIRLQRNIIFENARLTVDDEKLGSHDLIVAV
jgi:hypothetical protein